MLIIILSLKSLAVMWLLNAAVVAVTVAVALWLLLLWPYGLCASLFEPGRCMSQVFDWNTDQLACFFGSMNTLCKLSCVGAPYHRSVEDAERNVQSALTVSHTVCRS